MISHLSSFRWQVLDTATPQTSCPVSYCRCDDGISIANTRRFKQYCHCVVLWPRMVFSPGCQDYLISPLSPSRISFFLPTHPSYFSITFRRAFSLFTFTPLYFHLASQARSR